VDVSIQEAISNTLDTAQQAWDLEGIVYRRVAPFRPVGQFNLRCVYPCKDGYVACWAPETLQEIKDWMDEKDVPYDEEQMAEWIAIRERVAAGETTLAENFTQEDITLMQEQRLPLLAKMTRREIYEGAVARGFGWAPVNTPKDLLESEQLAARDYYVQVEHPELGETLTYPGATAKMTETPVRAWRRAPLIGEHNQQVYGDELGLTQQEMDELERGGVI
jgi:crotonobetainyl-CoA:carnitine CoA-transferase CaiB-like acyl-CoA transferase